MISEQDFDITPLTTFGVPARCRRYVEAASVEELRQVVGHLTDADRPLLVMGGGSNMLFTRPYPATVVHPKIMGVRAVGHGADGSVLVEAGAGEVWDHFVALCIEHGWHGAENLSLIPGEVGASAVQNIGAYGAEASDIIESVGVVDTAGEGAPAVTIPAGECGYGYRQSHFKSVWRGRYIVTHVTYRLSTTFTPRLHYGSLRQYLDERGIGHPTPQQVREAVIAIRRQRLPDPAIEGNAGSFFVNPVVSRTLFLSLAERYPLISHYPVDDLHEKLSAAWLIESCGWKGKTVGKAGVHSRQALVIVNHGGATGDEILHVAHLVSDDVFRKFGIRLTPEVNIL